jgi:serine/threonine protein kinase
MSSTSVGSFRYMSPERLLGEQYDASGDIWSVGIMMVQLWTKRYPFEDNISTPIDLLTELESLHLDRLLQVCLISMDVCWVI